MTLLSGIRRAVTTQPLRRTGGWRLDRAEPRTRFDVLVKTVEAFK